MATAALAAAALVAAGLAASGLAAAGFAAAYLAAAGLAAADLASESALGCFRLVLKAQTLITFAEILSEVCYLYVMQASMQGK